MALLEHGGFKVGDKVRLIGRACPKTMGEIKTIWNDTKSKPEDNPVFTVRLKNPDDGNRMQEWGPIYRDELVKAE